MNLDSSGRLLGIHHITALASDAQQNVDFYVGVLGLRLVKKTVNFDAPDVYHLYYGDDIGTPGTVLTFFPFPHAARGTRGHGELGALAFSLPLGSEAFWVHRLSAHGIRFTGPEMRFGNEVIAFQDPDGLLVELVFSDRTHDIRSWPKSPVPPEHAVQRFFGATMVVDKTLPSATHLEQTLGFEFVASGHGRKRFRVGQGRDSAVLDLLQMPTASPARSSAGSVHHIAWRVRDDMGQRYWQQRVAQHGLQVTDVADRQYFRSIYFREPGGVLFEIATDEPGFTVDEAQNQLGSALMLPPWLEEARERIERILPPVQLPRPRVPDLPLTV